VGIVLHKKVGELVIEGEPLLTVHVNERRRLDSALQILGAAIQIGVNAPPSAPLIQAVLTEGSAP
jgi:thymidine phosphorylase